MTQNFPMAIVTLVYVKLAKIKANYYNRCWFIVVWIPQFDFIIDTVIYSSYFDPFKRNRDMPSYGKFSVKRNIKIMLEQQNCHGRPFLFDQVLKF